MKVLCGTDIIEIERIKKSIEQLGQPFLDRVYTKEEIEYCESKKVQRYQHYAARFAAKEAVFKAVSDLLEDKYELTWQQIQISNDEKGKPKVTFLEKKFDQIKNIDISLSHCKEYATANVTVLI